jgi:hypothetical protein
MNTFNNAMNKQKHVQASVGTKRSGRLCPLDPQALSPYGQQSRVPAKPGELSIQTFRWEDSLSNAGHSRPSLTPVTHARSIASTTVVL